MSDEVTSKSKVLSVKTLWSSEEIPEPDNLGEGEGYVVKMWSGQFKRGLLIMPGPEGYFIPATHDVTDAEEVGILAEDLGYEVDENGEGENEYTTAIAYFAGQLNGDAIILPYEQEDDDHRELLAELADKFRKQGLRIL